MFGHDFKQFLSLYHNHYHQSLSVIIIIIKIIIFGIMIGDSASFRLAAELPQICRSIASYLTEVVTAASEGR